ncbi:hypothetical protein [Natranaerobius thermophilus]|uniref:VanZ-like domain-containing protein n=1 Tax=Natranaerobius thermophilus (strain ATCC BAA-1301 / DSM 18059 / JW/NM-WN-LF) TaxID=457570 RepID=B2A7V1_NATTJ|nr:hypothetical protein [Natranaerobius thermophilus]ACB84399.1 hypothetical protein Nther_0813 [Natranaerobius thermophilus JW/NM-WN-LF]
MIFKTVIVTIPLIIGSMIYIGWRPESTLMFFWFDRVGLLELIMQLRELLSYYTIPDWLLYWGPNGLWTLSFTAIMGFIWFTDEPKLGKLWLLVPIIFGITIELGQLMNILPGTFCYGDLIAHGIGAFTAFIILKISFLRGRSTC